MNCTSCAEQTEMKTRLVREKLSLLSLPSLLEFAAVILFFAAFFPQVEKKWMYILGAVILAILGHSMTYRRVSIAYCNRCNKEFSLSGG